MRSLKLALTAAIATVTLAGAALAQGKTEWIMASGYPEANFLTKNLRQFAAEVETDSGGKLKITMHTNDTLIKLDAIKRAVQSGQIQAGEVRLGVYGNEDPMYILDGVPFLASTYDEAYQLMEAQKPYFSTLFQKNGMGVIGYQVWPSQGFYTKTPVATIDDFKGKRLRIYSTATQRMGQLLGFNATILPFAEIPQAFSTGMIESLFTSAQTGTDIQAWDNTKYFTNVGAIFSKNAVIVNGRAWQRLPADVKTVVMKAGDDFTKRAWVMSKAADAEMSAVLKKNGMVVSEAPAAVVTAMKKVGEQMTTEWKATASGDAVATLNFYTAGPKTN